MWNQLSEDVTANLPASTEIISWYSDL